MQSVHQFLPTLASGDAIGYETLAIKNALIEWGYKSNIYVRESQPSVSKHCLAYTKYKPNKNDIIIFHFAIGSELSDYVAKLPGKKIMIYHNITPGKYLRGVNENIARIVDAGRNELKSLYNKFDLSLADSEYNRQELENFGYKNTDVLPLLHDFSAYEVDASKNILQKYNDEHTNIIFVGKIYPHKKQEDVIKSFYCYKKYINPKSRLFLVGHASGTEVYQEKLEKLIKDLDLDDVYITGFINENDLVAYYKIADVFLCMSEHEGFCVPLLESMHFKVPILAFNSTAIPHTLNNSAIIVGEKNYLEIAELIEMLTNNKKLREKVINKQLERLKFFESKRIKKQLKAFIESQL